MVTALEPPKAAKRLGMLEGEYNIPDDFDQIGQEEIIKLFEG